MANCPVCGKHLTTANTDPENRIILDGMDLPVCRECGAKQKTEKEPKITGTVSPSTFYFKSTRAGGEKK